MKKISVYIIALNEEARLPRTLEAVNQFADEVILVGSGSTDSTSEIARSNGAKVFYREWDNYSSQKAYAESLCSGEWLMNIDADEEVTPELASEIRMATASEKYGAYRVRISDIFPGQEKPNPLVKGYNVIRLYRRGSAQMEHTGTWDRVSLRGDGVRVGQLKGLIIHRSFVSLSQILEKYNKYTDQQVLAARERGKVYCPFRMLFSINLNFLRYYFIHRHFLNGWWGYINSVNLSYLRFLKFAKFYEYRELEKSNYLGQQNLYKDYFLGKSRESWTNRV